MHLLGWKFGVFGILLVFCLIKTSQGDNKENKLKDALRNNTNSKIKGNQNNEQNEDDEESQNALKTETQKMLKQCGVERESNSNYKNNNDNNNYRSGLNNGRNKFGNNGQDRYGNSRNNNFNNYGNDGANSNNEDGEWNMYSTSSSWNDNQNSGSNQNAYTNRRQSNFGNPQSNYAQSDSRHQNNYGNTNNRYGNRNENGYGSSFNEEGSMHGTNTNQQGFAFRPPNSGYQGSSTNNYYDTKRSSYYPNRGGNPNDDCVDNNDRGYFGNAFGYNTGMTLGLNKPQQRPRRSGYYNREENEDNEDNQCISQCVFGYLHLLDDDRTPSENLLIKWLQENTTGGDMDRIKALREARRCFARLSTSDIDDGCEFSKKLSECLELELE